MILFQVGLLISEVKLISPPFISPDREVCLFLRSVNNLATCSNARPRPEVMIEKTSCPWFCFQIVNSLVLHVHTFCSIGSCCDGWWANKFKINHKLVHVGHLNICCILYNLNNLAILSLPSKCFTSIVAFFSLYKDITCHPMLIFVYGSLLSITLQWIYSNI
jgi:hypothetical protein